MCQNYRAAATASINNTFQTNAAGVNPTTLDKISTVVFITKKL
jgi:hypothetical protein